MKACVGGHGKRVECIATICTVFGRLLAVNALQYPGCELVRYLIDSCLREEGVVVL